MAYAPRKKITGTMPFRHHSDDAQWIDEQLSILDVETRAKVAGAYGRAYLEACDCEPLEHKKEGIARRLANTRLRIFTDKRK